MYIKCESPFENIWKVKSKEGFILFYILELFQKLLQF